MNFTVIVIARNEAATLPRLIGSLKEFQSRGGKIIVMDTGSTDGTAEIAEKMACDVYEVGDRFVHVISANEAETINGKFIVKNEKPGLAAGDKFFDFAAARNYAASLSPTDMVAMPDADEVYTKLDIDVIEKTIASGCERLEYEFVFAHDQQGQPTMQFKYSKFYNRRRQQWRGVVHEGLYGEAVTKYLPPEVIKLEHWQNQQTNRTGYLKGLIMDCHWNSQNSRNSYYLARELLFTGRTRSAIRELKRRIAMKGWVAEWSQAMVFLGDAYMRLKKEAQALICYREAFEIDPKRREALMRLAEYYYCRDDYRNVAVYAARALEIPYNGSFAVNMDYYRHKPHEMLYWANWYLGERGKSKYHFDQAYQMQPYHEKYLHDYRFYYQLPFVSVLLPKTVKNKSCLESIERLNYPKELLEVLVEGDQTSPDRYESLDNLQKRARGDLMVFAANEMEFDPQALIIAAIESENYGLVSFKEITLPDGEGNVCRCFVMRRDLISRMEKGAKFCQPFKPLTCDQYLWEQAENLGASYHSEKAKIKHITG